VTDPPSRAPAYPRPACPEQHGRSDSLLFSVCPDDGIFGPHGIGVWGVLDLLSLPRPVSRPISFPSTCSRSHPLPARLRDKHSVCMHCIPAIIHALPSLLDGVINSLLIPTPRIRTSTATFLDAHATWCCSSPALQRPFHETTRCDQSLHNMTITPCTFHTLLNFHVHSIPNLVRGEAFLFVFFSFLFSDAAGDVKRGEGLCKIIDFYCGRGESRRGAETALYETKDDGGLKIRHISSQSTLRGVATYMIGDVMTAVFANILVAYISELVKYKRAVLDP
jgi:hypothetical protein